VWATGQRTAIAQRADRYVPDTTEHPGRMLPEVAAYAIAALTEPGQLVFDPMCGAGTTLVEAVHLGRAAVGIDVEPRWAGLARENVELTRRAGIGGHAHVITADSRTLPDALPPDYVEQMRGRVSLVLTSPPYGPSTHGQVRADTGGVHKVDFRYSSPGRAARNLAYQPLHRLTAGLTRILAGCLPLLAPHGMVAITTRPWREHGELVDLPDLVTQAGTRAGYLPVQRCAALLGRLDPGQPRIVDRASFFQRHTVNQARRAGLPWHLIAHEDVLVLRAAANSSSSRKLKHAQRELGCSSGPSLGERTGVRNVLRDAA
jgi:SAM-dependent methyltransferase